MKLGKEGQKLFDQYVKTLVISKEDAQKIIHLNKSALVFLSGESGLRMRSFNTNLSMLLRTTVFRKFDDFEPIKTKEILKIKKYYGIDIKPIVKDINSANIYELKKGKFIEDCINGDALIEDIDDYICEWENYEKLCELYEYLGMTQREYELWQNDKSILKIICSCHVYNRDIDKVLENADDSDLKMVARAKSEEEAKLAYEVAKKHGKIR